MRLISKNLILAYKLCSISFLFQYSFFQIWTICENCIPKECLTKQKTVMMKKCRGSYSSTLVRHSDIQIISWIDNTVATIASKVHGIAPIRNVDKYSGTAKKKCFYSYFLQYNRSMGVTNIMVENILK
ncbi:hypothetical protein RN001_003353 [Aquatica leii]|uniref:PiggyBac transposable element-derived protein domain-containing protein n=1 Tax=Aquatica leii TaxID=1421715 RepID=A0AAN7PI70_9COLE|nr:hypothetical protein RN001_003353 [Aquatica leii]